MAGITRVVSGTNEALIVSLWTQQLLYQAEKAIFWDRWSGSEGSNSPLIVKTDLAAKRGRIVKIDFVNALSTAGKTGVVPLSGAEEEAAFYQLDVSVDYARNAVAIHKAEQQHTMHNLQVWGRNLASPWLANLIDASIFTAFDGQTTNMIFGGDATSKVSIEVADTMTLDIISRAKTKAMDVPVRKINVDGREWLIMVMSQYQAYDLKATTAWQQAHREGNLRGPTNPIFTGALGFWDGVVLYENDGVEIGSNAGVGTNLDYAIAHMVGQNACGFGWAMYPGFISEVRDYGAVVGVGADGMWGAAAAVFNSVPIGHIPIMTAAADPN